MANKFILNPLYGTFDISSQSTSGDPLGPTAGGTGLTSYATGDMLYASAANTLSKRTIGSAGYVLSVSGGVPQWSNPQTLFTVTSWTPVVNFGGATTGITYTTQGGVYVVNNGIAFLRVSIELSSKGTAVGSLTITGVPAAVSSPTSQPLSLRFGSVTYAAQVGARIAGQVLYVETTASGGNPTSLTDAAFTNTSFIQICGCYQI